MSSDKAVCQSNLEDLVSLSSYYHQPRLMWGETRIVDSSWCIDFVKSQELFIFSTRVHTKNTMPDTQDAVNQLKNVFAYSSSISEFVFVKNEVIIPKNKHGIDWSKKYLSV